MGHHIWPARQHLASFGARTESLEELCQPPRNSSFPDSIRSRIAMGIHAGNSDERLEKFDDGARFRHAWEIFAECEPSGQPQFPAAIDDAGTRARRPASTPANRYILSYACCLGEIPV